AAPLQSISAPREMRTTARFLRGSFGTPISKNQTVQPISLIVSAKGTCGVLSKCTLTLQAGRTERVAPGPAVREADILALAAEPADHAAGRFEESQARNNCRWHGSRVVTHAKSL